MSEKKYYWLKLKDDFFKRHDVKIIEAMDNGKEYILFYLKLLVESISHEGRLRFSDTIPYSEKMLATITDTNIDIVRTALQVFRELNLVEVLDDKTLYMSKVTRMIGSESASAERMRRSREKNRPPQCDALVSKSDTNVQNCYTEIELDKDLDKEPDQEDGASAPTSSVSPADAERQRLVEKFGEENVKEYETRFQMWKQKKRAHFHVDKFACIEKWMIEDMVTKPKSNSSFDTQQLRSRVLTNYQKKEGETN